MCIVYRYLMGLLATPKVPATDAYCMDLQHLQAAEKWLQLKWPRLNYEAGWLHHLILTVGAPSAIKSSPAVPCGEPCVVRAAGMCWLHNGTRRCASACIDNQAVWSRSLPNRTHAR